MNVQAYYKSLTEELESLKNRVRNFIANAHWLTDGEWKESVLRTMLARRLPDSVKVGRGFIISDGRTSTQCDVLLYKSTAPVLFREGELVFLTPDAVLGVIEVKSKTNRRLLQSVLDQFDGIGQVLGEHRKHAFLGLFSYESDIGNDQQILNSLQQHCTRATSIVDFMCLGCSSFVKWWKNNPEGRDENYEHWHSYRLDNMAAGYFLANVVDFVCPDSVSHNSRLWFPEEGKEIRRTGTIAFRHDII